MRGLKKFIGFNKGYTSRGFSKKVIHLHVKPYGYWDEIYLGNYLRLNSDIVKQYETMQLDLKRQFEHNRDAYADAKSAFVFEYTEKARKNSMGRYLPN